MQKYARDKGKSKSWVKSKVLSDPYLGICADIANTLKHGGLDSKFKQWWNKSPTLGKLNYHIAERSTGSITFSDFDVEIDVVNPSLVVLEMPVLDKNGGVSGDAFKYLDYALKAWEDIIRETDNIV